VIARCGLCGGLCDRLATYADPCPAARRTVGVHRPSSLIRPPPPPAKSTDQLTAVIAVGIGIVAGVLLGAMFAVYGPW
jgi:hypothetical protein